MIKLLNEKKGFTLIELLMTIAILAIIAGVAAPLIKGAVDLFTLQVQKSGLEESSNYALARMTREFRRLRNDTSVAAATANNFEFFDRDNNRIRYYLSGNTIRRTENGTDRLFMDQVQNPGGLVFAYYNDDTADASDVNETSPAAPVAGLGVKTNIRYMKILIQTQNGPQMRTAVRMRNVQQRESDLFF